MTTHCPEHPGRTGNELPECRWCIQEADLAAQGIAAVRAALAQAERHPTERPAPDPIRDRAIARAKTERTKP